MLPPVSEVAGSGLQLDGAAAGAGRRFVSNNPAGAGSGDMLKSPVLNVAGSGFQMKGAAAGAGRRLIQKNTRRYLLHLR